MKGKSQGELFLVGKALRHAEGTKLVTRGLEKLTYPEVRRRWLGVQQIMTRNPSYPTISTGSIR